MREYDESDDEKKPAKLKVGSWPRSGNMRDLTEMSSEDLLEIIQSDKFLLSARESAKKIILERLNAI